jgi:hypothetical protein
MGQAMTTYAKRPGQVGYLARFENVSNETKQESRQKSKTQSNYNYELTQIICIVTIIMLLCYMLGYRITKVSQ